MKFLIDAHMVGERETGNETYLVNLIRGLSRINRSDHIVVASAHRAAVEPLITWSPDCTLVSVSANPFRRLLSDLPRLAKQHNVDLLCVTYTGPLSVICPTVAVVHDVSFKRHPEWFSLRDRIVLTAGVGATVRRAAAVVTLSEFSKCEIAQAYRVPLDRIHAIPLAAAPEFTPDQSSDDAVLAKYRLFRPYVLAVGNLQPRKNLSRLIEAFTQLQSSEGFRHDLVLAGHAPWRASIQSEISRLAAAGRIKTLGYVPAAELPALYRGADVFVYPSLYEGFGLPVIEAMACGTPVIASNGSAIPEVAGNAARLVDSASVPALADAIAEICAQPALRAQLRERGLERSRMFTWEQTAAKTLDVFHRVGGAGGHA